MTIDPLYRPGSNPDYPDSVSERDFDRAFGEEEESEMCVCGHGLDMHNNADSCSYLGCCKVYRPE